MPRDSSIGCFGGPLTDHHHVLDPPPRAPTVNTPTRLAQCSARSQADTQLSPQAAAALHVERLVYGLVRDPHAFILREVHPEAAGDLFGTPALSTAELALHVLSERATARQLADLRPAQPPLRVCLRETSSVLAIRGRIAFQLPANRRRGAAEPSGDCANADMSVQDSDLLSLRD